MTIRRNTHTTHVQSEYVTSSNRIVHEPSHKTHLCLHLHTQISVIQGNDPANAINPHTTAQLPSDPQNCRSTLWMTYTNTRRITSWHILHTKLCFWGSSYLPSSKFITITHTDCWTVWSIRWTFQLEHARLNDTRRETSKTNTSILP
jgi:hypothetical protein